MPAHNSEIAAIFNRYADLLEIQGANRFQVRAYRNAALTISSLAYQLNDMVKDNEDLTELPGIGKDLADKIKQIIETGKLPALIQLEKKMPKGIGDLMMISNLGPKRVKTLYEKLKIDNINKLKKAAAKGNISKLEGFGKKTEQNILESIERKQKSGSLDRIKWVAADEIAQAYVEYLHSAKGIDKIETAGSYRRRRETVGDLDILVSVGRKSDVMKKFVSYEDVDKILAEGTTKSSVLLKSGLQVDLRAIEKKSYGAALLYFTGSKAHNVKLRKIAMRKKYKLNEYGIFKGEKQLVGKTENDMFGKLGMKYIEPELREDTGEIEASMKDKLPKLIELDDIRGDLQSHTTASDGQYSLEDMAKAAQKKGYDYLAITDHSKRVTVANGLDEKRLGKLIDKIDKLNESLKGFRLLKSVEVDILKDGTLDLADDILKKLDIVICAIHYDLHLSKAQQTSRVLKAMDNRYFNIFAHPTGRRIPEREPYEIDLEKVMNRALENSCYLELNAQPDRLDLPYNYCKMAKEMDLKIAISTDAHSVSDLDLMKHGIAQARKGWLEKDDVLNTRNWKDLKKLIKRN